jgi:two-component system cell cycle response regulator
VKHPPALGRGWCFAPIAFNGLPLGAVVLATPAPPDRDQVALLDQLRADLGLAVNNAQAHERLETLAAVDPLTDAYNRRFGLARLEEELARSARSGQPLGLLMFDVDRFKAVNDTRSRRRRPGPARDSGRGPECPAGRRGRPDPLRR